MSALRAIKPGVWTSKDRQRRMTIEDHGHGWIDVSEYNKTTGNTQSIKVGRDGFNQFEDQLIDGGWTFSNKRQYHRRSK